MKIRRRLMSPRTRWNIEMQYAMARHRVLHNSICLWRGHKKGQMKMRGWICAHCRAFYDAEVWKMWSEKGGPPGN